MMKTKTKTKTKTDVSAIETELEETTDCLEQLDEICIEGAALDGLEHVVSEWPALLKSLGLPTDVIAACKEALKQFKALNKKLDARSAALSKKEGKLRDKLEALK